MEEVGFGLVSKRESQFCPNRKAWNGGGLFWPELDGLDWQMLVLADCFPQNLVRVGYLGSGMTHFRKRKKEVKKINTWQKWSNQVLKKSQLCQKVVETLSKRCQNAVKKLLKFVKKLSKSCKKVVKRLSKSSQKNVKKLSKKLSTSLFDFRKGLKDGKSRGTNDWNSKRAER
jgi:ElaB/YqjD/DUF883 family membrane-anchored ribosome-binding protein